jgi:hypothetical protein
MCKLASFPILIQFWSKQQQQQQQQGKNSKNSTIFLRQEGTAEDTCVIIEYFLLGRGKTVLFHSIILSERSDFIISSDCSSHLFFLLIRIIKY